MHHIIHVCLVFLFLLESAAAYRVASAAPTTDAIVVSLPNQISSSSTSAAAGVVDGKDEDDEVGEMLYICSILGKAIQLSFLLDWTFTTVCQ